MTNAARVHKVAAAVTSLLEEGVVVAIEADGIHVRTEEGRVTVARAATDEAAAVRPGDDVVLASGGRGRTYVIGVLRTPDAARLSPARLTALDGTSATLAGEPDSERLEVRDATGRVLFQRWTADRRTVVHTSPGDLELRVDEGNLDLVSGRRIRLRAADGVEVTAKHTVTLATEPGVARTASAVRLGPEGVSVATPMLDARAQSAALSATEARLVAKRVDTAVERVHQVVGVLETHATRILERARNTYREVEDLAQLRAGRMRFVAEATFHLFGRRALFKAKEDVSIQGEKIYLA